jgi:hypothetical protein
MKTIETTASVTADHRLIVHVPADIPPGEHRVVVTFADQPALQAGASGWQFPVIDVGPWPEDLSLRREDMYGDNGR